MLRSPLMVCFILSFLSVVVCAQSYCTPASTQTNCASDEYISNVTITDGSATTLLNNSSACIGLPCYENFTSSVSLVQLYPGMTYGLSVTVTNWFEGDYVCLFVDQDINSSFEGTNELMATMSGPASNAPFATLTCFFTLPMNVAYGPSRLRLRLLDGLNTPPAPLSCGNAVYGNCEDYAVNLWGMPSQYQLNGPTAALHFDGLLATAQMGAVSPMIAGSTMVACANAFGFMADVFANYSSIVPAGGGGLSAGPHIVNLDILNGGWVRAWDAWVPLGPSFGTCAITFPVPSMTVSAQMVVLDPTSFMGVALSQACQINGSIIN